MRTEKNAVKFLTVKYINKFIFLMVMVAYNRGV